MSWGSAQQREEKERGIVRRYIFWKTHFDLRYFHVYMLSVSSLVAFYANRYF